MTGEADELRQLAADMSHAPADAGPFIEKALEVTARGVKDTWNDNLGGRSAGGSFRHVGRSVDYDMQVGASSLEAEIGPNLARTQGAMAGWFEEGMRNIPAAHAGYGAMKANEADFVQGMEKALADGLAKSIGAGP